MKKEVSAKYKLVGVKPGRYHVAGFGFIDLVNMSLALADQLYKAGFPFLQEKKTRKKISN